MPPRRLHLPRLIGRGRAALWCGTLIVVAVGALALWRNPTPTLETEQRAAVSLLLFGQDDPDALEAAGLHGLGGRSVKIEVRKLDPCRYVLTAAGKSETIDFSRITDIRYSLISDPAAGIARGIERRSPGPLPQRSLAILAGAEDAFCDAQQCTGLRAFALSSPDRSEVAQAAAADFRRRFCPGDLGTKQTPGSP